MSRRPERYHPSQLIGHEGRTLEAVVGTSYEEISSWDRARFARRVLARLELSNRAELLYLLGLDRRPRRFRLFAVGLVKTGTSSMAELFAARFRARREFLANDTAPLLQAFLEGRLPRAHLLELLRCRGALAPLELDSAFFHYAYVDLLRELWPDARFVFLLRDAYSWLGSILDFLADPALRETSRNLNALFLRIEGLDAGCGLGENTPVSAFCEGLLGYWSRATRLLLDGVDPRDSLVVRTDRLSSSLDRLADFAGIPDGELARERAHANATRRRYGFLRRLDESLLRASFARHCEEIMRSHFGDLDSEEQLRAIRRGDRER